MNNYIVYREGVAKVFWRQIIQAESAEEAAVIAEGDPYKGQAEGEKDVEMFEIKSIEQLIEEADGDLSQVVEEA